MQDNGRIIKALSGFYDVQTSNGVVTCKGRGHLRQGKQIPLVGDRVEISLTGHGGMIECILPRKNEFLRPPVANLDALVILAANVNPVTEPFLIDRVAAIAGNQNVAVILCVNKTDLDSADRLISVYRHAGFPVIATSAATGEGVEELRRAVQGKTVAFTGNSGVGKSSILNCLSPALALKVGEVSEKLGRGRHTTRHVQLYALPGDTYIADTPGFSSFDTEQMDLVIKENLQYAFSDFAPFLGQCQFHDCTHRKEPCCRIRQAVADGEIEPSRYQSYLQLYEHAMGIKLWELPKKS